MSTIMDHVSPRVERHAARANSSQLVATLREDRRHCAEAYRGGLPAERSSAVLRRASRKAQRAAVRAEWLSQIGRKIDLGAMLNLTREDGHPLWCVVDPREPLTGSEGNMPRSGCVCIGGQYRSIKGARTRDRSSSPAGMPALPTRVRELFTSARYARLRERSRWIGVLYQPEEWREINPDPAVVVEWQDRPGEYFALAVWGHDGPRIMEWVD